MNLSNTEKRYKSLLKSLFFAAMFVMVSATMSAQVTMTSIATGVWTAKTTWQSSALTGGASTNNGSVTVTGTGTLFLTELAVGDILWVNGVNWGTIASITNNLSLTLNTAATSNITNKTINVSRIPKATENVVLAAGFTVTVDGNYSCNNLTVTGNLAFDATPRTLTVNGNLSGAGAIDISTGAHSLILNGATNAITTFTTGGALSTVTYSGAAQQVFASANYKNISFAGTGTKTLAGNISVAGTMGIISGVTLDIAARTASVTGASTVAGTITSSVAGGSLTLQPVNFSGGTFNATATTTLSTLDLTMPTGNVTFGIGNVTVGGTTVIPNTYTLNVSSNSGTKVFVGNLNINTGGTFNNSGNSAIEFRGGLQNDGTFTQGTGNYSFTTNSQSISGSSAVTFTGNVTVGAAITLTNSNTNATGLTLNGTIDGAAATSIFDNRGNCVYANATQPMNTGTLTADQALNTFTYSSTAANQAVKAGNYYHLTMSGGIALITKTLGGNVMCVGNLTFTRQTITDNLLNYVLTVKGNVNGSLTGTFGGNIKVTLAGTTAAQTIAMGTGTINSLEINNTNGVALSTAVQINGTLTFTIGNISVGNNILTFGSAATIAGAGGNTKMIVIDGTGEVRRNYAVANPLVSSFTFPIGDNAGNYSPVTLAFTTGNSTGTNYSSLKVTRAKHASNPSATDYLTRYWTFNTNLVGAFTCNATCTFLPADIAGTSTYIYGATYAGAAWTKNTQINTVTNTFVVPLSSACDISGIDGGGPVLSPLNIVSNNAHTEVAKQGDIVYLTFTSNETISSFTAFTIGGKAVVPTNIGLNYTATLTLDATVPEGVITFSITARDNYNNTSVTTATTDFSSVTYDRTAPNNQNTVFPANQNVSSAATVTIVSSGLASNQVWFAPAGLTNAASFVEGLTMTKALDGTATSILAPTTPGTYYCYVIDYAGNVSAQSTATLSIYVPPTLADIETSTLSYIESSGQVPITSAITVTDDGATISSAVISISANYINGQDVLSYVNVPPITGTWVAATGTLTLSGVTTKANYETALRSVKYQNTISPATYSVRTVSFRINDGTNNSNTVTRNIDVVKKQPYITSTPVTSGYKTLTYTYNITVVEPGTTTTISASGYPANITFTDFGNNTARLQGIPANAGSYPITITATDGTSTATQNFTLVIGNTITVTAPASIQTAINSAAAGDLILVNPGTYIENIDFNNKNVTVASTYFSTGNAANISSTIINGNSNGSVVTFKSGETSNAKLIGFTLTAGTGKYIDLSAQSHHSPYAYYGGGIYIYNASPVIDNCIISNNSARYYATTNIGGNGGGIYIGGNASPTISNCSVTNNSSAGYRGGGICIDNSNVRISNTVIQSNTGGNYGGGIACYNSTLTISGSTISSNTAANPAGLGGGVMAVKSTLDISTSSLSSNSATKSGNGSYTYGCTKTGTFSGADIQVNVP